MLNLLKADFYKLFKSKLTYISLIIFIILSLLLIVLYKGISIIGDTYSEGFEISGKSIMFGSFSLTNNTGLLIPIFAGIFTISDIKHGTIRNKILFGQNRIKIYISNLIVSSFYCVLSALISFLVITIGQAIFFKYGASFSSDELLNFIRSLLIGIFSYIFVASISTFFALVTKSTPITVVLTIFICLGLSIISSLSSLIVDIEKYKYLFYILPTYATNMMSGSGNVSGELFVYGIISLIFFISLNTILGILLFKKRDLK